MRGHFNTGPFKTGPSPRFGAEAAFERLMPCLQEMGITRLGDITGLDRIGIPVVQAVRPLGLANAVTQGKGSDLATAAISAVMESAEQFFAERVDRFRTVMASAEGLGAGVGHLVPHVMPHARQDWAGTETAWVRAVDDIAGGEAWLPLELVHTAYVEPGLPTDGLFFGSTTGLACAFCERDALLHAVLECVERDAIARAHRTHGFFQRYRIDMEHPVDDDLEEILEKVRSAGLCCAFWIAAAAAQIPALWCQLMENGSQPVLMPYPADGFAAHPDPAVAARQAVLEAAQSRLAAISGGRDDITRASYPGYTDWTLIEAHRRLLARGPRPVKWGSIEARTVPSGEDPYRHVLDLLEAASIDSVLAFRYDTAPFPDIAAVRVIVPQLSPLTG